MVQGDSGGQIPVPDIPRSRASIWASAIVVVGFIAMISLTVEGTLAWLLGSAVQSTGVLVAAAAMLMLPTLYVLAARVLPNAVRAERDLTAMAMVPKKAGSLA